MNTSKKYYITPISQGKNNNIHLIFKLGYKKQPIFKLKIVGLFDLNSAFITNSNLDIIPTQLLNLFKLKELINEALEKYDLKLFLFSDDDFFVKNLKTEDVLRKIEDLKQKNPLLKI